MEQRTKDMRAMCKTDEISATHHAFIVNPLTGSVEMFGKTTSERELFVSDLSENEPVDLGLKKYICHFGVLKDDFRGIVPNCERNGRLASHEDRERFRENIKTACSIYRNCINTRELSAK
jgi:hypothetical protein